MCPSPREGEYRHIGIDHTVSSVELRRCSHRIYQLNWIKKITLAHTKECIDLTTMPTKLLSPEEAAPLLCLRSPSKSAVDRVAFWAAVNSMNVPRFHLNKRRIVFSAEDIFAWLETKRRGDLVPDRYRAMSSFQ